MSPKLPLIQKGHHGGMDFQNEQNIGSTVFLYATFIGVIAFFCMLVLRLFQLSIVKGEYYHRIADGNRIREYIIEAKRGTIIDRKGIVMVENNQADPDQTETRIHSNRRYLDAESLASVIGYRQTADQHDIDNDPCLSKIDLGDRIGKKGVEKRYDCDLRGRNGKKLIEIDATGKIVRTIGVVAPEEGKTLQLALDAELQKKAYDLIHEKRAVVVALRPQTGEVLTLVSTPTFNAQDFEDNNNEKIKRYFTDENKPLFNRATEGTYPPGSVFKLTVAVGALEEKSITAQETIEDTGKIKAGPIEFGNWYFLEHGKTEGFVDMVKAIKRSNDIYFYKVGEKMGESHILQWSERFGYGKKTGIGIDEAEGLIPSPFWKEEVLNEKWYLGDTYNTSIGQGYMLVTPLQVAQATAVVASNGYLCKPKLLKVGARNNIIETQDKEAECKKLPISEDTFTTIHEGMVQACSPGGTGWPLFNFKVTNNKGQKEELPVACKTGTAESHSASKTPHAWFTAYAPAKDPEIVVTVLVEESGQGSDIAGPIARDVLSAYFERKE